MPAKKTLKISRRDALKILATAGVVALAALPDQWSEPIVQFGALPAHAQTSGTPPIVHTIAQCGAPIVIDEPDEDGNVINSSTVTISPADSNISMHYSITTEFGTITSPASPTGDTPTVNGVATVNFTASGQQISGGLITLTWTFTNVANGSGTCDQTVTWVNQVG